MIVFPQQKACAVCSTVDEYGAVVRQKPVAPAERGLCGNAWLEPEVDVCKHCGHVAPDIAMRFPKLDTNAETRATFATMTRHTERARRYLAIAALYGDEDPRAEGWWVLEAAWANEREGRHDASVSLRLRAACLLETALWMGRAIVPKEGASARCLAECFRVAKQPDRAREHVARAILGPIDADERKALLFELHAIEQGDERPHTWADARAIIDPQTPAERMALMRRTIQDLFVPERDLTPVRELRVTANAMETLGRAAAFAVDYLEPNVMASMLERDGVRPVTTALEQRRDASRFGVVLGHASPTIRLRALDAFVRAGFPREHHKRVEEMLEPLLARLGEPSAATPPPEAVSIATNAALLAKALLPRLDASGRERVARAASDVLRVSVNDLSLEGALERLASAARA